jgi:hypothetical protein
MRVERLRRSSATLEIDQYQLIVLRKRRDEMPPAIEVCAQSVKTQDRIAGAIDFSIKTN